MPLPAQEIGQQAAAAIEVEQFGLGVGVLHPLGTQEIAEAGFTAAGRAKDQGVAYVSDMVDHAKQGGLLGMGIEPWSSMQVAILRRPWPGRREARAEMAQGQGMLRSTPHII